MLITRFHGLIQLLVIPEKKSKKLILLLLLLEHAERRIFLTYELINFRLLYP